MYKKVHKKNQRRRFKVRRRRCWRRRCDVLRRRPPNPKNPRPNKPFLVGAGAAATAGVGDTLLEESANESGDAVTFVEEALLAAESDSPQCGQRVKQPRALRSGVGDGLGVLIGELSSGTKLDILYIFQAKSLYAAGVFAVFSVSHSALISCGCSY